MAFSADRHPDAGANGIAYHPAKPDADARRHELAIGHLTTHRPGYSTWMRATSKRRIGSCCEPRR
jgi:hypothetical protein